MDAGDMDMELDNSQSASTSDVDAGSDEAHETTSATASLECEITEAIEYLEARRLSKSAEWLSELRIPQSESQDAVVETPAVSNSLVTQKALLRARQYFDQRQYERAAHSLSLVGRDSLRKCPVAFFIYSYAMYLSGEKKREETTTRGRVSLSEGRGEFQCGNPAVGELYEMLDGEYKKGGLDGPCMYIYGVVLKEMQRKTRARDVLVESLNLCPLNWSAWLDLIAIICDLRFPAPSSSASLDVSCNSPPPPGLRSPFSPTPSGRRPQENLEQGTDDSDHLTAHASLDEFQNELGIARHWIVPFVYAAYLLELQLSTHASAIYSALLTEFPRTPYLMGQLARCWYNLRKFDEAQVLYEDMLELDPYRLEGLDAYSNILFVTEQAPKLSQVANQVLKVDRFSPETCCITGNYFSLKGDHEKALVYFRRALRLNRKFGMAWILMGHEFMELKNTYAAIDAYRNAAGLNPREFRAWYGLGQAYDILFLHAYALYYYKCALALRPFDSRMWAALASCYERIDRHEDSLLCLNKAHQCGMTDSGALLKLFTTTRKLARDDLAAHWARRLLERQGSEGENGLLDTALSQSEEWGGANSQMLEAMCFLAEHCYEKRLNSECQHWCLLLQDAAGPQKEKGKAILRKLLARGGDT